MTNWYGRDANIERKVIIYPQDQLVMRTATQYAKLQSYENAKQIIRGLDQLIHQNSEEGNVRELEVEELCFKCGMIKDDG